MLLLINNNYGYIVVLLTHYQNLCNSVSWNTSSKTPPALFAMHTTDALIQECIDFIVGQLYGSHIMSHPLNVTVKKFTSMVPIGLPNSAIMNVIKPSLQNAINDLGNTSGKTYYFYVTVTMEVSGGFNKISVYLGIRVGHPFPHLCH